MLTAGVTVVIGMLGLLVLRQSLLNGVAVAAAVTVAMTVLAALTLLPALLGFTGTRLLRSIRLRRPAARTRAGQRALFADPGPGPIGGRRSCSGGRWWRPSSARR